MEAQRKIRILLSSSIDGQGITAIIDRYITGKFIPSFDPTISNTFKHTQVIDKQEYNLEITEICDFYHCKRFVDYDGFLIVCSFIERESFLDIPKMCETIKNAKALKHVPIVVIANKLDCEPHQITISEIKEIIKDESIPLFETSALTGQGINEAFEKLTRMILGQNPQLKKENKKMENKQKNVGADAVCIIQ